MYNRKCVVYTDIHTQPVSQPAQKPSSECGDKYYIRNYFFKFMFIWSMSKFLIYIANGFKDKPKQ